MPSAWAAICAATVNEPCPNSCPPSPTLSVASSLKRTHASEPGLGGMAGAFQHAAMPLPRRLCSAEGTASVPHSTASATEDA